ncbi:DNA polymerase III subunit beta [Culicoidibacter larvae]|uniref:Beta sliding clamp n=1 Tax=Culicoidibacter larvae TaxID=2579976 RepID=A0A5R8QIV1_9FIRM|nr:DNA polymerase III subunit beta [Culicoidibacter larvae]TLG77177.1 DNA polymerase III subunit beta [Culicoidibacter larvae]
MKFSINRSMLLQLLNHVTKSISSRVITPILSGIKFEVTADSITLTGSNTEMSIITKLNENNKDKIQVEQSGTCVLPSKYITEIIKKIDGDTVSFELIDTNLMQVYTTSSEFTLNTLSVEEYPNIFLITEEKSFQLQKQIVQNLIKQTVFATSQSESRPILTGVNFVIQGKDLIMTATDSYRLAQKKVLLDVEPVMSKNLIIPAKTLQELSKILDEIEDNVLTIYTSQSKILFITESICLQSNLIEGNYPDTSKLIPTEFNTVIEADLNELLHAIDRASLLSRDIHNNIVNADIKTDGMEIKSISQEIGQVREKIQSAQISGDELKISFNARYALDALKAMEVNKITISLNGELKPFIIHSKDDENLIQLILPIRTY